MTNPELAPDMPEERSMEFTSDDDPNVRFRMMQDSQGDIWLAIITPQPEIMSSFRLCTRQGGGHKNNRNLWQAFAALLGPGPLAELRRADLAPQAGSVDVEGLKREIRENMGAGYNNHYYMGADIAVDYLVERNLLNPGPQGWREKDRALVAAYNYINASPQELLDVGKSREDFLKEFHTYCPNLPSPPNKETISGAPVGGDRPAIPGLQEDAEKEFIRKHGDGNPPDCVTSTPDYEGSKAQLDAAIEFFENQSQLWNPHIKPLLQAARQSGVPDGWREIDEGAKTGEDFVLTDARLKDVYVVAAYDKDEKFPWSTLDGQYHEKAFTHYIPQAIISAARDGRD